MKKILAGLSLLLSATAFAASNEPLVTQQTMQNAINQIQQQIGRVQAEIPAAIAKQTQRTQQALDILQKNVQQKITALQQQIQANQASIARSHNLLTKQIDKMGS